MAKHKRLEPLVIVGGGISGLTAAITLCEHFDVIVLERSNYQDGGIGEHLTPDAVQLMADYGFAKIVEEATCEELYGVMSIWGGADVVRTDYYFHPPGYGLNLARPRFDLSLVREAKRLGVNVILNSKFVRAQSLKNGWKIEYKMGETMKAIGASYVIDASGRSARFARTQGSRLIALDRQIAFVGYFRADERSSKAESKIKKTSIIEAVETGWWYFSTLGENRCVCAFVTDYDTYKYPLKKLLKKEIQNSLHVKSLLAAYPVKDKSFACSARTQRLNSAIGTRWLAVGDAALALDPVCSHGIISSIKLARAASEALLGRLGALESYAEYIAAQFSDHLRVREKYYGYEARWPESIYWQRRHAKALSNTTRND